MKWNIVPKPDAMQTWLEFVEGPTWVEFGQTRIVLGWTSDMLGIQFTNNDIELDWTWWVGSGWRQLLVNCFYVFTQLHISNIQYTIEVWVSSVA